MGEQLRETIEEFKTAEGSERQKLGERLTQIEEQVEGLTEVVKREERRPNFADIEIATRGERDKFSLGRALHLISGPADRRERLWKSADYGLEVEVHKHAMDSMENLPLAIKAEINAATDVGGGFLIPTELQNTLLPELESNLISARWGVTIINGLMSNVTLVKDKGGITAYYVDSETAQSITESVSTFDLIELRPHVVATLVPVTHLMLQQPAIALDSWIGQRMTTKIALREDKSVFLGTGADAEPRGVFNDPSVLTHDYGDTGLDFLGADQNITTNLRNAMRVVANQNANLDRCSWAMSHNSIFAIAQAKDADGKPLFQDINMGLPASIFGQSAVWSTQLAAAGLADENILYGQADTVTLGRWGGIMLAASPHTASNFAQLRTSFRAVLAHDVAVTYPEAMVKGLNFNVTSVIS